MATPTFKKVFRKLSNSLGAPVLIVLSLATSTAVNAQVIFGGVQTTLPASGLSKTEGVAMNEYFARDMVILYTYLGIGPSASDPVVADLAT